jgi:hypothetical protein
MQLHEAAGWGKNPVTRVAVCRRELARAIPVLTEHAADEENALRMRSLASAHASLEAERVIAQNIATLRELRTLLDTADRMIEDDTVGGGNAMASLCAYLLGIVEDLLRHEASGCPLSRRGIAA